MVPTLEISQSGRGEIDNYISILEVKVEGMIQVILEGELLEGRDENQRDCTGEKSKLSLEGKQNFT